MRLRRLQTALFAATCALGAAAGCATSGQKGNQMYSVECTDSAPTGSHIARTKCYRRIDADERTRKDRASMEKLQYDTARPKRADGVGNVNKTRPLMTSPVRTASAPAKNAPSR
jgi:hypothetical protein